MKSFLWAQEIQNRRKQQVDRNSQNRNFTRGQLVLIFMTRMFKKPAKLTVRWSGPFWVYAPCGPTLYFLATMQGEVLSSPVNGFRMRLYHAAAPIQCPFPVAEDGALPVMMVFAYLERVFNVGSNQMMTLSVRACRLRSAWAYM